MRPRKKVKLADIAEKMGVSVVTVSNALAGKEGVSEALRGKIEACAAELGYRAGPGAEQTNEEITCISVLSAGDGEGGIPEEMTACLMEAAVRKNVRLSVGVLGKGMRPRVPEVRWLTDREGIVKNDGILVCGPLSEKLLRSVIEFFKVPVVGYGFVDPHIEIDYIADDGFRGIRHAVKHLTDLGHRDLIYVEEAGITKGMFMERYLGFWYALYEYRLIDPVLIPERLVRPECGMELLESRLREGRVPDAVVCGSDETAASVLEVLSRYSLRVPGDVSVTGCRFAGNEDDAADFFSSCSVPLFLHAEKCLDLLKKRIARGGGPDGVRLIDCGFSAGKSTGIHKEPVRDGRQ